ncbi:hypothetical protein [Dysgonomonas sp. 25]|uniref:EF-Tu C-terminal domain-related protein n=1 Tax=Dysgonomonas sp. 25 TaxID=2302933 RepID=UPI00162A2653|nr:hypothetical protein [Dysgonomonas sp. 25]
MTDKNHTDHYALADKFARDFYVERKAVFNRASNDIEKLNIDEGNKEKIRRLISDLLTDTFYTILTGLDGCTDIGESLQETYKIYNENGDVISECGELETEAYEYFHENKYETENSEADFIAVLTYKTIEEGGRKTAAKSGYRSQIKFDFDDMQTSGQQIFIERRIVFPGDTVRAEIKLASIEYFENKLKEGMRFEFREGDNVIGTGEIKSIINKKLYASK